MPNQTNEFLKKARAAYQLPESKKINKWVLPEYPLDSRLLTLSPLYLKSRQLYLQLGGQYFPRVCSTMRSLSAQDLFANRIEYSPIESEVMWFYKNTQDVTDPEKEMEALIRFCEISVFHEQNHRVIWQLLPAAPKERDDFRRYLNFAESLVVTLDMILGDELGLSNSILFEQMRVIYRSGGRSPYSRRTHKHNRDYYIALCLATYYLLEIINTEDILPALNYVLPGQKALNISAVTRSLELSELFTRITNPQWQERYWKVAQKKLAKIHQGVNSNELYLPEDPLDFGDDLSIVHHVLDYFKIF